MTLKARISYSGVETYSIILKYFIGIRAITQEVMLEAKKGVEARNYDGVSIIELLKFPLHSSYSSLDIFSTNLLFFLLFLFLRENLRVLKW